MIGIDRTHPAKSKQDNRWIVYSTHSNISTNELHLFHESPHPNILSKIVPYNITVTWISQHLTDNIRNTRD